jgi:hypothetical protein
LPKFFQKHHPHPFFPPWETVSKYRCEGGKRLKQSHNLLKIMRLPRSLRSLAMTDQDCNIVSQRERVKAGEDFTGGEIL